MSHELDMTNGRANIAFLGSRNDVWHRMGQEMKEGMTIEDWAKASGLGWEAGLVPAFAQLPDGTMASVNDRRFIIRKDTNAVLGHSSNRYQTLQPSELLGWFRDYVLTDDRFQLDVAGSLKGGATIWATAIFREDVKVAGDSHRARLLMTTTFDGSGATRNQATMTRVVCDNTRRMAVSDNRAAVSTRHSAKFKAAEVAKELEVVMQGFEDYKKMGEGLAQARMPYADVSKFFKTLLEIPFETPKEDISTRKLNQFEALKTAYASTVAEGTEKETGWTAFNAVTRYVDHDRAVQGTSKWGSEDVARFLSANFGSGDSLKNKAVDFLGDYLKTASPVMSQAVGVPVPAAMWDKAFAN